MTSTLHHIRLLAGFEVQPDAPGRRQIDRNRCEPLAAALAEDLARLVPEASSAMLVVGGSLLDPQQLLRPGWPAWEALGELARPVIRERGSIGQVLAIGSHQGRMPDARLGGAEAAPGGQFLAMPMLLISDQPLDEIRRALEEKLFEAGGVHPPTRAALSAATGTQTVHGQLLTLADLIALQHVQMDTAGLGAFWPVVEHILLEADQPGHFELPAGLAAAWSAADRQLSLDFQSLDQFSGHGHDYAVWLRAFRSLCALLDAHAIAWRARSNLVGDADGQVLMEPCGPTASAEGLTEHHHPDCGLIAWTLVENGQQTHLYPLSSQGFQARVREFQERGLVTRRAVLDDASQRLTAASET